MHLKISLKKDVRNIAFMYGLWTSLMTIQWITSAILLRKLVKAQHKD